MGMSIEEAIPILQGMYDYYNDVDVDAYVGFDKEDNNAIETALDTMQKYQKIQEIATTLEWEKEVSYQSVIAMMNIRKVVEDGNDD